MALATRTALTSAQRKRSIFMRRRVCAGAANHTKPVCRRRAGALAAVVARVRGGAGVVRSWGVRRRADLQVIWKFRYIRDINETSAQAVMVRQVTGNQPTAAATKPVRPVPSKGTRTR